MSTLLAIAAINTALVGCGANDANNSTNSDAGLDGRSFVSTDAAQDGEPFALVPNTVININFRDATLSANTGCNTVGGAYQLHDGRLVTDGQLSSTEMGCEPSRMDQDQWFIAFLSDNPTVTVNSDSMTLATSATTIDFIDEEVASPDLPLTKTSWKLDGLISGDAVSSVPSGVEADLSFAAEGEMRGNFGCNQGGGPFEASDTTITFGQISSTRMLCPSGSDVERSVLKVLDGTVDYTIDGSNLTLTNGTAGLTYKGTPA